jgi:DNA-directed RNA polymerase subunit beta'
MAYQTGTVDLHSWVEIRFPKPPANVVEGSDEWWEHRDNWGSAAGKRIKTTVGRMIFNEVLHPKLRFLNVVIEKKQMGKIIDMAYRRLGTVKTAEQTDAIKALGFHYATRSGSTIAISDIRVPAEKAEILADAEKRVEEVERNYKRGLITNDERYQRVIAIWAEAKDNVTKTLVKTMEDFNPVNMMMKSGARGNISQITQLAGMRGLMADPSGKIVELPVKANFREGLTVLEYFLSTHGTRKGLADTALRTADSGYLTRRLVDVSQDVIVREDDCGTTAGITWTEQKEGETIVEPITAHIVGRTALYDIEHPVTGQIMVYANEEIDEEMADQLKIAGITELTMRSVLTCRTRFGVCRMCYGRNLATGRMVDVGEAVGIIAAQSIGEPGTQLTMRTFHTGGVAGDDITQGLPRVEELFEARKPKGQAVIAELDGRATITENKGRREITITNEDGEATTYSVPYGARVKIRDGAAVEAGDELTEGSVNPHDLLRVKGLRGVQMYLLREVQKVYNLQGVDINDKHIEVMVRQMLRKVKVEDPGDTELLPGGFIDIFDFEDSNEKVIMDGGVPSVARPMLLGITKASLATDSFLSAASFQETTRVLTDAAIKGKRDPLLGLKENVIIGKLVPAGTGMSRYRSIKVMTEDEIYAEQLPGADD